MSSPNERNDEKNWAVPVERLRVGPLPPGAVNLNVDGRQLTGPLRGFGQLWQKTYRVRLSGAQVSPEEVIKVWKEQFGKFWPAGNHFFGTGEIAPGNVALLNLAGPGGITAPGGAPIISTGVVVIYSDAESFSFMTPEGHMFAGMITFSSYEQDSSSVAQVQAMVRASDPLFESALRLGIGHSSEDAFWRETLMRLAAFFGVRGEVQQEVVCLDPDVRWSEARNVWQNAALRTAGYYLTAPFRMVSRVFSAKK